MVFFVGYSRFSRGWSSDEWPRDASWKRSGFSSRRPSRHPLHGRNDMKTSENRFSRQKHAHKQRKKGLSCHHALPLYFYAPATPTYQKRSGSTNAAHSGTVRHHQVHSGALRCTQVHSGALRYSLKRSTSILVQPSTSVSSATTVAIATTVSRATDTLYCFNGLQQSQRPSRPQTPEEPQRPQGWMPSFDFRLPIPQLSEKNQKKLRKNFANCNYCVSLELGRVVRERP